MFHHDAQLGQLYCLRGTNPVVVGRLPGRPAVFALCGLSPKEQPRVIFAGRLHAVLTSACAGPACVQVATELALKLQAAVPDYARWRHLLADALDLPMSGAWRAAACRWLLACCLAGTPPAVLENE